MEEEFVKYLKALVYLKAVEMSGESQAIKGEVLLANAGLSYREIGGILGKTDVAVRKAISRARVSAQPKEKP